MEMVFYKLVGFIEINIGEKLRSVIANRQSFVGRGVKEGFVVGDRRESFEVAFDNIIVGGVLKNDKLGEP